MNFSMCEVIIVVLARLKCSTNLNKCDNFVCILVRPDVTHIYCHVQPVMFTACPVCGRIM